MPAHVCWINKECLQLKNLLIPIKCYQRKASFPTTTAFPPNYLVLLQYFPMRHQGLSQLILNIEKKEKSEKVEFNFDILYNTQIPRATIYLCCPICVFFFFFHKVQMCRDWSDDTKRWGLPMGCWSHTEILSTHERKRERSGQGLVGPDGLCKGNPLVLFPWLQPKSF